MTGQPNVPEWLVAGAEVVVITAVPGQVHRSASRDIVRKVAAKSFTLEKNDGRFDLRTCRSGGTLYAPSHLVAAPNSDEAVRALESQRVRSLDSRASSAVHRWLSSRHPWLADIPVPDGLNSKDAVMSWLASVTVEFGEFHEVEPMPFGMYVGREPIAELREMAPNAEIIEF